VGEKRIRFAGAKDEVETIQLANIKGPTLFECRVSNQCVCFTERGSTSYPYGLW